MFAHMITALSGLCQMCGSPAASSLEPFPLRMWTPLLVSTISPFGDALLIVSSNHFSRPTPFFTMTSASASAAMSAGEGS